MPRIQRLKRRPNIVTTLQSKQKRIRDSDFLRNCLRTRSCIGVRSLSSARVGDACVVVRGEKFCGELVAAQLGTCVIDYCTRELRGRSL